MDENSFKLKRDGLTRIRKKEKEINGQTDNKGNEKNKTE